MTSASSSAGSSNSAKFSAAAAASMVTMDGYSTQPKAKATPQSTSSAVQVAMAALNAPKQNGASGGAGPAGSSAAAAAAATPAPWDFQASIVYPRSDGASNTCFFITLRCSSNEKTQVLVNKLKKENKALGNQLTFAEPDTVKAGKPSRTVFQPSQLWQDILKPGQKSVLFEA